MGRAVIAKAHKLFREYCRLFPKYAERAKSFGLIGTDGRSIVISFNRVVPRESIDDIQPGEIWFRYKNCTTWETRMYTTDSFFDWDEVLR